MSNSHLCIIDTSIYSFTSVLSVSSPFYNSFHSQTQICVRGFLKCFSPRTNFPAIKGMQTCHPTPPPPRISVIQMHVCVRMCHPTFSRAVPALFPFFFFLQKCCTRAENSCSQLPALRFDRWKHAFCLGSAALPAGLDRNTHNAAGCAPCGTRALLMRNKPPRLTGGRVPPRIACRKRPGDTTHKRRHQSMI